MTKVDAIERAERLGRRRARMLPILAIVYLSQQFTHFYRLDAVGNELRTVDLVQIGAWMVLTVVLLTGLSTFAFWTEPRPVRDLLQDEATTSHRSEALIFGFWTMVWSAIALYVLSLFEPVAGRTSLHIILSAGIGVALLRFGRLELEAARSE